MKLNFLSIWKRIHLIKFRRPPCYKLTISYPATALKQWHKAEEFSRIISPVFPPFQASDEAAAINEESHAAAPNYDDQPRSRIGCSDTLPGSVTTSGIHWTTTANTKRAICLNGENEQVKKKMERKSDEIDRETGNAFQETKFLLKLRSHGTSS